MMSGKNRYPFTNNQWEELEHQALIFKYMISGMQIPPHLLLSVKTSMDHLSLSSRFFPHQSQQYGWNCLQMGLGGRKIDPEPGRCRRTDGKKWRCSKEAYTDSKYCERHMHRGKNRSRKPVEISSHNSPSLTIYKNPISSSSSINITPYSTSSNNNNASVITSLSSSVSSHHPCYSARNGDDQNHHPFYYQNYSSPSRGSSGIGLSSQSNNTHMFLDSNSYARTEADYRDRYVSGLKEEVDEHLFFSEASGTMRNFSGSSMDDSCQLTPLTMSSRNSLSHSKRSNCSEIQNDYSSYLKLQSLATDSAPKMDRDNEPQKTIHHFFDEWPLKTKDSWLNLDDNSSSCSSLSTTQLSISVPTSSHVFPIFNTRTHNDG